MNATTVIPTDLVTPLGAYLRLRPEEGASFLLESVEHGRLGRHSFVGHGTQIVGFEEAEALDEPVVGFIGYDHVARLEPTVPLPDTGPDLPESQFVVAETLVKFDHVLGMAEVLRGDPVEVAERLDGPLSRLEAGRNGHSGRTRRFPGRFEYVRGVERAKQYIREGDAFQIVLSQRAERATRASAVDLYRSLRRINPSPYLFLLELDGLSLVGSSPETLVKVEQGRASVNPIAGTVPRGPGDVEKLLASEKDRAEHVMLVDLGRNDLSRVCRPGSVHVERFLEPERFSHVTHLVSEVVGDLQPDVSASTCCVPASRPARSRARRRCGRCRSSRSLEGTVAAPTRARSATRSPVARSTPASRSGRSCSRTGSRTCRRVRGSSPTRCRRSSTTNA